jgi:hypothetical protein
MDVDVLQEAYAEWEAIAEAPVATVDNSLDTAYAGWTYTIMMPSVT